MKKDCRAVVFAISTGRSSSGQRPLVLEEILGRPMILHPINALRQAGVNRITVLADSDNIEMKELLAAHDVRLSRLPARGAARFLRTLAEGADLLMAPADAPTVAPSVFKDFLAGHRRTKAAASTAPGLALLRASALRAMTFPTNGTLSAAGGDLLAAFIDCIGREVMNLNRVNLPEHRELFRVRTLRDLADATAILRRRVIEEHMARGVVILDPDTTYIEEGVEIGRGTEILPFTVIHRGVKIGRGCEVGPFSHLRAGAVLDDHAEIGNFVEVKKSFIGAWSKAKHLSYLGDATLGRRVNIGAGTITANYDGKRKHPTALGDGASTGSNTVLVAPIRMGRKSRTGAGAVVVSGHDVEDGDTVVGVPARSLRAIDKARRGEK